MKEHKLNPEVEAYFRQYAKDYGYNYFELINLILTKVMEAWQKKQKKINH